MKSWAKLIFDTCKVFVLFTGCTIFFYFGLVWINEEYEYYHRYDEPENGAIKASTAQSEETNKFWDRFVLFYLNGE